MKGGMPVPGFTSCCHSRTLPSASTSMMPISVMRSVVAVAPVVSRSTKARGRMAAIFAWLAWQSDAILNGTARASFRIASDPLVPWLAEGLTLVQPKGLLTSGYQENFFWCACTAFVRARSNLSLTASDSSSSRSSATLASVCACTAFARARNNLSLIVSDRSKESASSLSAGFRDDLGAVEKAVKRKLVIARFAMFIVQVLARWLMISGVRLGQKQRHLVPLRPG